MEESSNNLNLPALERKCEIVLFSDAKLIQKIKKEKKTKIKKEKENSMYFTVFYERYKDYVRNVITSKANNITEEEIEDLIQKVFLKIYDYIDEYEEKGFIKGWISKITRSKFIDYLRKKKSKKARVHKNTMPPNKELAENFFNLFLSEKNQNPEESLLSKEFKESLFSAIEKLPDTEKEILKMRMENLSFKKISLDLEISINTALGRMRNAKQRLLTQFKNTEYYDLVLPYLKSTKRNKDK